MNDCVMHTLLAIISSSAATFFLYKAWQKKQPNLTLISKVLPWLLFVFSLYFWVQATGPEFGTVYALLGLSFFTWLSIYLTNLKQAHTINSSNKKIQPRSALPWPAKKWLHNIWFLVLTIPIAGVSSISFTMGLMPFIPAAEASVLILCSFLSLLIWAALALWCLIDKQHWRPALIMLSTAATTAYIGHLNYTPV